jgi:hypothetical protein
LAAPSGETDALAKLASEKRAENALTLTQIFLEIGELCKEQNAVQEQLSLKSRPPGGRKKSLVSYVATKS